MIEIIHQFELQLITLCIVVLMTVYVIIWNSRGPK